MPIENNLANHGKRFSSFVIDLLPIQIIVFLIFYFFIDYNTLLVHYFPQETTATPRMHFLKEKNMIGYISFILWILYCTIMECSKYQGTFGKTAMNIKVVDSTGNRLSFSKSLQRNLSKIISNLCIGFGFVWILFDKQNQGWHDKLNNTFVVNKYSKFKNI
ncbi:RDD family protein [Flavobacterium sp. TSSA_36]|uniref:RDD family protein n=1 Tax=Flavobacterium sp. TSSA_36 TaxID=3447669 RepID=UPI003F2BBF6F